ncbi:phage head-tail joining protein [Pontibaca methylaminivorans]|uniref:phage head-tail joining protein n=1 Tax=Pontibaca methylaminivorans TaxID=515897 RepID=UPI002FD9E982
MTTVTRLREFREQLQDARFSGVRTIRDQNGEEVTYRSQSEIERAIAAIDSEIATLQRGRSALIRMQTSKGI